MSDAFGALSSRLRLFADAMHDAFIRLDGGDDITELVQDKLLQCGTMLEASPDGSKIAAVERRAINSFATEVLTVLEGPKGPINALRRRLGPGRNVNPYVDNCKPRIGEWRKRVEDAIHLRDVEAKVILQDMGIAIGGGFPTFPTQDPSTTLPPRGVAQAPVPETSPGLTVDAVLALHERLLGYAESSSARIDVLVRNHDQVLNVAGISEREREHMQRVEERIAALDARQKRTNIMIGGALFFFTDPGLRNEDERIHRVWMTK